MHPIENKPFVSLTKAQLEDTLKKYAFQGHNINRAAKLLSQKGASVSYNAVQGVFSVEKKGHKPIIVDLNKIKGGEAKWTRSRFFQQRFSEGKIKKLADAVFNQIHPKTDKSHDDPRTSDLYQIVQEDAGGELAFFSSLGDISKMEKHIARGIQAFQNKDWDQAIEQFERTNESPMLVPYKLSLKEVLADKPHLNIKELRDKVGDQFAAKKINLEGKRIYTPSKPALKSLQHYDNTQRVAGILYCAYLHQALEEIVKSAPDNNQIKADIVLASKYGSFRRGGLGGGGKMVTPKQVIEKVEELVESKV